VSAPQLPPALPPGSRALLVVALLIVCGAAGFLGSRFLAPARATLYPAPVAKVAAAPAAQDPAETAPPVLKVPEQVPDISLPRPDGSVLNLDHFKGQPLMINFWATWCEPCRREIPLLRALRHERARDRLEIVGIAIDSAANVQKYASERGIDYPVLIGEQGGLAAASAFGMDTVLPFTVFADRSGDVITVKVGELHRDEADFMLDRIGDLDTGRLTLSAARTQIAAEMHRLALGRATAGANP
jgi:thiol-disulfide isomerase/thioredoxin